MKSKDSLGHLGVYAVICGMIARAEASTEEIAQKLGVQNRVVHRFLRYLEDNDLAHVHDWIKRDMRKGEPMEVWGWGFRMPAPRPLTTRGEPSRRSRARPDGVRAMSSRFVKLIKALEDGATRAQLHEASGISLRTLTYLLPLLRRQRLIRVEREKRRYCGGQPIPVFALGGGNNVDPLQPICPLVLKRNYRERKRAARTEEPHRGYSVFTGLGIHPSAITSIALLSDSR